MAKTDMNQGVLAVVRERRLLGIEDLLAIKKPLEADGTAAGHRFFLALDGVEDPHNLGALLRTADAVGVDGVVLPERRSAPLNATVAKTSAGASEHVRVAKVTNLVRSLEQMKQVPQDQEGCEIYYGATVHGDIWRWRRGYRSLCTPGFP